MGDQELVDEVAFRAHDLDAVVAGALGQAGAVDEVANLLLDALLVQLARRERVDRRLDRARRDQLRTIGVAPGMQQLQADLRAVLVRGGGQLPMRAHFPRPGQLAAERGQPADHVGGEATGHQQCRAAGRALAKVRRQLGEFARVVFQPGMHRAHQDAVAQLGETQVQRGKQVRIGGVVGWRHGGYACVWSGPF